MAGVVSVCATYPLDLIRSRLVCQIGREGTGKYAGIIDCWKQIYQQEGGVRALYGPPPALSVLFLDLCWNNGAAFTGTKVAGLLS